MRSRRRYACALLLAVLVGGCASHDDPTSVGALGPGFVDPARPPAPESTITPRPGSWDAVHPPKGYSVVLLTAGKDVPTKTLVRAVTSWAEQEHVSLTTVKAADPDEYVARIREAIDLEPDLVISAGNRLAPALDLVTASFLDQQFLLIASQLAEPTANVTAAGWTAGPFTDERAGHALRAGVAAVLNGFTGIVIRVS